MSAPTVRRFLFDHQGNQIVSDEVYALERTHDLLAAALRDDARRRWWTRPDRLWVGRVQHALNLIDAAIAGITAEETSR